MTCLLPLPIPGCAVFPFVCSAGLGVEPSASGPQVQCSVPKPGSQPWQLFTVFSIGNTITRGNQTALV